MKKEIGTMNLFYPLPVVLVTTHDSKGNDNIITVAWTTNVSSEKPYACISIGGNKLSLRNIKETKDFVINIPGQELLKKVDFCGENHGDEIDKFKECNLTGLKANITGSKLIAQCPVNIECVLKDIYIIESGNLIIGEIVKTHADEEIITDDGSIDLLKLNPVVYSQKTYYSIKEAVAKRGFSKRI